jgi:hypothetical protein
MSAADLVHDEQALAWDLRAAWVNRRAVRLTLTENCVLSMIVGKVSAVSVTGAFVTVDGWHVPTEAIRAVGKPLVTDTEAYAHAMHDLKAESSCSFCEGKPVRNGRGWVALNEPGTVACPRCGKGGA